MKTERVEMTAVVVTCQFDVLSAEVVEYDDSTTTVGKIS